MSRLDLTDSAGRPLEFSSDRPVCVDLSPDHVPVRCVLPLDHDGAHMAARRPESSDLSWPR